jgi:2-methylisocitrate lyase-like PEP mutase family enzyme
MTFADLHHGELPLLLPNAWDVPSALALLECGFTAIGTTSFGVASSIGRPDGGRSTREANIGLAVALRPLDCYTSLDIEDGYADDPGQVADYVARLPVDGINIEDSTAEKLIPPPQHAAKVQAIKQRSPDVFVNARVDTYWLGQDATVAATLDRAAQYIEAGADGIFVPGATEPDVLRQLTTAIPLPVNVLAIAGLSLTDLAALGVRRVSTGSLPYLAAIHAAAHDALRASEVQRVAATDLECLTGDERRLVGAQKHHRRDDVVHLAEPVHELESIDELGDQGSGQIGDRVLGVHQARCNRVDADAIRCQFGRECDGQAADRELGHRVRRCAHVAGHRRDVEYHAAAAVPHRVPAGQRRIDHTHHIDVEQTADLVARQHPERLVVLRQVQAGVVDHDVDTAEPFDRRLDSGVYPIGIGNVAVDRDRCAAG